MIRLGAPTRRRGQALVEFALVLPIFLLLIMLVLDFGRAVIAYHTVSTAARTGARVAIVNQNLSQVEQLARQQALTLDQSQLSVTSALACDGGGALKIGCTASVDVRYQWTPLTPIVGNLIGPIEVGSGTAMPIERVYVAP